MLSSIKQISIVSQVYLRILEDSYFEIQLVLHHAINNSDFFLVIKIIYSNFLNYKGK